MARICLERSVSWIECCEFADVDQEERLYAFLLLFDHAPKGIHFFVGVNVAGDASPACRVIQEVRFDAACVCNA